MHSHVPTRVRTAVCILAALLLTAGVQAYAINLRFSPVNITVQAKPGETINRALTLTLSSTGAPARVKSRVEDWWRSADNNQTFYAAPGTITRSCGPWCSINPAEATIDPGGKRDIRLTMRVPRDVKPGGYWAALTVDEVPDPLAPKPKGVAMVFRSSLSVGVFVEVSPATRAARITDVRVTGDRVAVTLRNEGNTPLRVSGRFEFYKPGENEPVARVELAGEPLLPEPINTCEFGRVLPSARELPSGKYRVRAIVDVGLDHLMGAEKELEITRPGAV